MFRLHRHDIARRQAARYLRLAISENDSDRARERLFELTLCRDPLTCDCLSAKPLRKMQEA